MRDGEAQPISIHYPFDPARYEPRTIPIGFLNQLPNLRDGLIVGICLATHAGHSPSHCKEHIASLRLVLLPFLTNAGQCAKHFEHIDRAFLLEMWRFYSTDPSFSDIRTRSRWAHFDNIQIILEHTGLCGHVDWFEFPPTGQLEEIRQRAAPDPDELAAVIRTARTKLIHQMDRFSALSDPKHALHDDPSERRIIAGARRIRQLCRQAPPPSFWYFPDREEKLSGITCAEYDAMCSVWCPTHQDLMPAAILTAFDLRLDGQLLRDLQFSKITTECTFGPARTQVEVVKRRGKKICRPSCPIDDEPDNPRQVIQFLCEWTQPFRATVAVHPRDRDRVFIGQCKHRKQIGSMDELGGWLNLFLSRNSLPRMTFSQIRKGVIDAVSRLTAGDRALKAVAAGHTTVKTGDVHYSDDGERGRLDEALAQHAAIRDRTRANKGRGDARHLTAGDDPLAATPGWTCASPYDGPPGYRSATVPCSAYGLCRSAHTVDPFSGHPTPAHG